MTGATPRPYAKAFACAAVAFVLFLATLFLTQGSPGPTAGEAVGRLAATVVVPALITGFITSRSKNVWPAWRIILIYIIVLVVVGGLMAAGQR